MAEHRNPTPLHHVEHVMGTVFSFDIRDTPTPHIRHALRQAVAWLHHVDAVFSTYRPHSPISRLGRGETTLADCPPEVAHVLDLCAETNDLSGGWFDPHAGGTLDPSGLVKGWSIEHASHILADAGAHNTYVNGGGDIRLRGEPEPGTPWNVGIAHPLHPGELCAVVTGRDLAIATSGTAERGPHILDPHTGEPATTLLSLTMTGPSLTRVDAYATAAFAMGHTARPWIERLTGYEAFVVTSAELCWSTTGFPRDPRIGT
ncbi:FAD:protein FMN transferase [Embleya sp. NPDC005575]|uniref:FAD:protein FMN transferase n=1 Tax=Embleya sp. NPDC005575 TaxID=3156892 RepID=UPI0033A9A2F8